MFEKLKRAKSFVVRTRTREELDLSESSHLRRNVAIDGAALRRQRQLTEAQKQGQLRQEKARSAKKLDRQISASHERIYDDRVILEQIRRINFGDSRSTAKKEVVECYNGENSGVSGQERVSKKKSVRERRDLVSQEGRVVTSEERVKLKK